MAQDYCDASFTLADPGKSYTAWNSIKTLCEKGYVWKNGKPAKFSLTETGIEMAEKLRNVHSSASSQQDFSQNTPQQSSYAESSFASINPSTARSSNARRKPMDEENLSFLSSPTSLSNQTTSMSGNTNSTQHGGRDAGKVASRGAGRGRGKGRGRKGESTGAMLDRILAEMGGGDDNDSNAPDMSHYVLNPSKHQTISLNGRTASNTNTPSSAKTSSKSNSLNNSNINSSINSPAPKSSNSDMNSSKNSSASLKSFFSSSTSNHSTPSTSNVTSRGNTPTLKIPKPLSSKSSSITSSNRSNFAQRVSRAEDNNEFDDLYSKPLPKAPLSASKETPSKRQYNVDEFEVDLTLTSLPKLNPNTQPSRTEPDIVDLLSSPEISPALKPQQSSEFLFQDDFDNDYFPLSQSRNEQIINDTFHYTYLNSSKEHVRHVTMADTQWIDGQLAYLVKFYSKQSNHPKARKLTQQIMEGEYATGYAYGNTLDTVCPGLPATPVLPLHQEQQNTMFWPNKSSQTSMPTSQLSNSQKTSSQMMNTQTADTQAVDYDTLIEKESCDRMLPSEYEIFLVLDNREIQMKTNRDYFQQRLASKGVNCLTRSLDLGDVLWIAKKKGTQAQTNELVLGYIVERKRLDDLVTSIKDGRFTEQKTRLKNSGMDKVIYVVEEYNREEAERFGAQAIQTAMSSTQIIDGIFLKRTNSIDETIDYLVSATNLVKKIYKDTTLYSIPGHLISHQNYLDLKAAYKRKKQPKTEYLVNYPLFNQINAKNASTTIHDIYLHMLMTIRGVNAERALSLMKVFPTPHSLLTAFRDKTPEEGKLLAKNATATHITRRRWGVSISEKLYQTWGASSYPNIPTESDDDFE